MPISTKRKNQKKQRKKKSKPSKPKWEAFEKLVAAIHTAEMKGATVTWNEKIKGRQFDVAIRFKTGFYDYLTLIECKDYSKSVPVEKVEAFITKVRHQNASKAIMVSPHGFQKGAKDVAEREGIELYSLRQINKMPENRLTDFLLTTVIIQPLGFYKESKEVYTFSRKENEVEYQIEHIKLEDYGGMSLSGLLYPLKQLIFPFPLPGVPEFPPFPRATKEMQYNQLKMADNTFMISPETGEKINIDGLHFRYWTRTGYLVGTQGIDPTVFAGLNSQYEYKNELNEEVNLIDLQTISYGIDTILEKGKFYSDPRFKDFIFCCEKVEKDTFTMFLIKSYQHGKLIRSEMQLPNDESNVFVEITDEKDISDGKNLYNDFVNYKENNPHTLADDISKMWVS